MNDNSTQTFHAILTLWQFIFFFFYFYFYWSIAALHVVLASVEKQSELESEEELKSLLMKVKEKREKVGLKPNIQNTKIMAFGSITSWQIYGETMETVTDFSFWVFQNHCRW